MRSPQPPTSLPMACESAYLVLLLCTECLYVSLQSSHEGIIQCPYNLCLWKIRPNRRSCTPLEQAAAQGQIVRRSRYWLQLLTGLPHGATALTRAIDLALALDMVSLARELAHQGNRIFPEDRRLQQAMAVLAPPVVRGTRPAQSLHLTASQRWLKEPRITIHRGSGSRYAVALCSAQLQHCRSSTSALA